MKYVLIYLCIIFIVYYTINKSLNYELFNNQSTNKFHQDYLISKDKPSIPKVIISTYFDKKKIPNKVYENIKLFAPNYKYIIFDDEDIVLFLKKYYDPSVLNTFYMLNRGAFKADLFRYCYLYLFGGLYIDIKTKLIKNIDLILNKKNTNFYTVLSMHKGTVYQGIIACKPKNPIFLELINHIVNVNKPIKRYFEFTKDFYNKLKLYYPINNHDKFTNGYYKDPNGKYNLYLFEEKCTKNPNDCEDGLDWRKRCCYIYDKNNKIIKTRYADYPWK